MKNIVDFTSKIKDKFAMRKDIAPVEESSTASRAYSAGDKFFYGNLLQKAITDIAQGASLVGGTNFENADPVTTTIQNLSNNLNVNESKNILPLNPPLGIYYGITVAKSSNYWTADGTASASPTAFSLLSPVFDTIPNCKVAIENTGIDMSKTYRFSRQTKVNGLRYNFRLYNGSTLLLESTLNDSNNLYLDIDMSQYPTATHIAMGLEITNGTVLSLSAIKPMLSLVSDYVLDSSWTPWAENNYALTKDKVSWADEAQLGAANLADNVLTSQTITDGNNSATLTIVVNEDKSATLNGTLNTNQYLVLDYDISRLIGKPIKVYETDVFNENAYSYVTYNYGGSNHYKSAQNGVFIIPSGATSVRFCLVIYKNITFTNYTLYPMVTIPSYNGPYAPYAKTNKELTKDVATNGTNIDNISKGTLNLYAREISANTATEIISSSGVYLISITGPSPSYAAFCFANIHKTWSGGSFVIKLYEATQNMHTFDTSTAGKLKITSTQSVRVRLLRLCSDGSSY